MSVNVAVTTPQKEAVAAVLRSIANMVETCKNKTVTVQLAIHFDQDAKV